MMEYSTRQNLPDLSQKEKSDFTERIAFLYGNERAEIDSYWR